VSDAHIRCGRKGNKVHLASVVTSGPEAVQYWRQACSGAVLSPGYADPTADPVTCKLCLRRLGPTP